MWTTKRRPHLDNYYGSRKMNKFLNIVRRSKDTTSTTTDNISICTLHDYYTDKFSQSTNCNTSIQQAESEVNTNNKHHENNVYKDFRMNEEIFVNYVSKLRLGCAAGVDDISAENIKWARYSKIIPHLCQMLSVCVRFDIVPDSFTIPLIKKPNIDPPIANNYRPVVISTTFSKLLQVQILEQCGEHEFHDIQFGFVESRGTAMAAILTHDVRDNCVNNGSPVYVCSLGRGRCI